MLQIALIRPGSSEYDEQGRIQGKLNIPLSERGIEEVDQLAEMLSSHSIDTLYTTKNDPAEESGEILSEKLNVRLKKLDILNVDHGLWEGMLIEEVKRKHPKIYRLWEELAYNVCPPEGETLGEAFDRIVPILKKVVKKHSKGLIAIIAPLPIYTLMQSCLTEGELGVDWQIQASHGNWDIFCPHPKSLV